MVGKLIKKNKKTVDTYTVTLRLCSELLGQKQCCVEYMTVNKAFCKSIDGSFGRSITCRKSTYLIRIRVYNSKDKLLSFPWKKWLNIDKLPSGH